MRKRIVPLLVLAGLFGAACPSFTVPEGARLSCTSAAECPQGWHCLLAHRVCVPDDAADQQGPVFAQAPEWRRAQGKVGEVLEVALTLDEALIAPPVARLGGAADAPGFTVVETSAEGRAFVLRRTLDGSEPEGRTALTVVLVDLLGNESRLEAGEALLDFTPPALSGVAWALPAGKTAVREGDLVSYRGHLGEAPATLAVRVIVNGAQVHAALPAPALAPAQDGFELSGVAPLAGLGAAAAYAQLEVVATDAAGNPSDPKTARTAALPVDLAAPVGAAIALRGKPLTRDAGVLVDLAAQGAVEVRLGGDIVEAGSWRPLGLAGPASVSLLPGIGLKTVTATFRDEAWNETAVVADSIEFDPTVDQDPPRLVSAAATSNHGVFLVFDEPLAPSTAEATGSYTITAGTQPLAVAQAQLEPGGRRVLLATEPQAPGVTYRVEVIDVRDASPGGNLIDPAYAEATFTGFGAVDTAAPTVVSPADGAATVAQAGAVRLVWSERFGAASYEVEIFRDAALTQPVGAPRTSNQPELVAVLDTGHTYHWRVRADVTEAGQTSAPASFSLLGGAVHVRCLAAEDCSVPGSGSVEHPFRRISDALGFARLAGGAWEVRIAERGAGARYEETLSVSGGASLLGGWDAGFTGRDVATRRTSIASRGVVTLQVQGARAGLPVRLDGLALFNESPTDGFVVYAADCDSGLTIVDCTVTAGANQIRSYGLYFAGSGTALGSGPVVMRTSATGGDATDLSAGLAAQRSALDVVDSVLVGADLTRYARTFGALIEQGSVRVVGSTVRGGRGGSSSKGLEAATASVELSRSTFGGGAGASGWGASVGAGVIESCVFTSGDSSYASGSSFRNSALVVYGLGTTWVTHSTLVAGAEGIHPTTRHAALAVNAASPIVTNSILAARGGDTWCLELRDPAGTSPRFASFQNNLVTGCTHLVATEQRGVGTCTEGSSVSYYDCFDSGLDDEALMTKGADGTAAGNLGPSSVADFGAIAFADPAADDFRLTAAAPVGVRTGGKDTRSDTCGSDLSQPCGAVVEDLAGNPRPGADGSFAIGAFEP